MQCFGIYVTEDLLLFLQRKTFLISVVSKTMLYYTDYDVTVCLIISSRIFIVNYIFIWCF